MMSTLWSRFLSRRPRTAKLKAQPRRRSFRPTLEQLETRLAPATQMFNPGDTAALIGDLQWAANRPDDTAIINLQAGATYELTGANNYWYGPNGLPPIASEVIIHGNGAIIARDFAAASFRFFYVSGGLELTPGSLTMDNVTLTGGRAKGGDSNLGGGGLGAGGAIFNQGTLFLTSVTLADNAALGGSSGVATAGDSGGGMGGDGLNYQGGGFGGNLPSGPYGGSGGSAGKADGGGGGGGGGGFLSGDNGANGSDNGGGAGGGRGFGGGNGGRGKGDGGGGFNIGGDFGQGGGPGAATAGGLGGGGGGGIGGGGGSGAYDGGSGGFGGGGGAAFNDGYGGSGGFGGGSGGSSGNNGGDGGDGYGGAIFNMGADSAHPGSGLVTLINCTLTGNSAQGGQGGTSGGVSGSGGFAFGGALFNLDGSVTLINSTLAANSTLGDAALPFGGAEGGAIFNAAFGNDINTGKAVTASLVMNNSILAGSVGSGHDLFSLGALDGAAIVLGTNNLVTSSYGGIDMGVIALTADPNLGPLQNNSGLTPTMLPRTGSPVLGAGIPGLAPAADQRGVARPPNGPIDLGAVQVSLAPNTDDSGGGSAGEGGGSTGGSGSSNAEAKTSAGLFGLAMQSFELTFNLLLALAHARIGLHNAALDARIAQLQSGINDDPLFDTVEGHYVILLGQNIALGSLGSR